MFCANCGASNPDEAAVCGVCGAQLDPKEEEKPLAFVRPVAGSAAPEAEDADREAEAIGTALASGDSGTQKEKKSEEAAHPVPKRVEVLFYSLFGLAAAAVIILAVMLSGRSAQTTAIRAAEAWFNPSTSDLYRLIPRAVRKTNEISRSAYRETAKEADARFRIASTALESELGSELRFSVQVRNTKRPGKDALLETQTRYQEVYGLNVSDACLVKVRVTASAGGDDDTYNLRVPVVKIGLNWYLDETWSDPALLEGYDSVLEEFDLT